MAKTFFKINNKLAKLKISSVKNTKWCTNINNAKNVNCCALVLLLNLKL